MLDTQNQGPQCTACGSPMRLSAIEPGSPGRDLRTFTCPRCGRLQRQNIESAVTDASMEPPRTVPAQQAVDAPLSEKFLHRLAEAEQNGKVPEKISREFSARTFDGRIKNYAAMKSILAESSGGPAAFKRIGAGASFLSTHAELSCV